MKMTHDNDFVCLLTLRRFTWIKSILHCFTYFIFKIQEVDSQIVAVKHSQVFAGAPSKDVATWSQNDVLNWLKKNHLEG